LVRTNSGRSRGFALRGALGIVAFWLVVMAGLYWAMERWQQPTAARVTASGALVIERHRDGHFRVAGAINGEPVMFLVDTGASVVSVSTELAQRAGLSGGESASFRTANGVRTGRMVRANSVSLQGGLAVTGLRVATGLSIGDDAQALLGQNFLQHFDVEMGRETMVLRPRAP
jgi:aspartyl protease family protein